MYHDLDVLRYVGIEEARKKETKSEGGAVNPLLRVRHMNHTYLGKQRINMEKC